MIHGAYERPYLVSRTAHMPVFLAICGVEPAGVQCYQRPAPLSMRDNPRFDVPHLTFAPCLHLCSWPVLQISQPTARFSIGIPATDLAGVGLRCGFWKSPELTRLSRRERQKPGGRPTPDFVEFGLAERWARGYSYCGWREGDDGVRRISRGISVSSCCF